MQDNFSPQQSLQLIQSMIDKTRDDIGENRFYFLFWGWLVFITILSQFFLKVVLQYGHHYLVWILTVPAVVVTIVYSSRRHWRHHVRTYIGESMGHLWTGIGISFFVLSIIISQTAERWSNAFPFFILFYGLGTFISGRLLQLRPLVVGGIINWALAVVCVFLSFDYQMLVAAAAILTSYIIPGHFLPARSRSEDRFASSQL